MVKALRKKWGIILIIGVVLMCVGIYICKMPREMNMYDAFADGIEKHIGVEYKDIQWESVHFPLTSEDNKNWIESNKSPQAVEDTIRNKLENYTVLEKGETMGVSPNVSDLWIHANANEKQLDVKVKIDMNNITVFYNNKIAIEYEIIK
ncbi:MAG: hypothetical protein IJN37_04150 [Clostridia bacterium]|nr:hypothetical protein [Clostridia bacterium]